MTPAATCETCGAKLGTYINVDDPTKTIQVRDCLSVHDAAHRTAARLRAMRDAPKRGKAHRMVTINTVLTILREEARR